MKALVQLSLGMAVAFAAASAQAEEPAAETAKPISSTAKALKTGGEISFDDIKLDIDKDGKFEKKLLTDQVKTLDGKSIAIKGYLLPTSVFQQKGIKQFVLVRDNKECCFGPGAAIHDCIVIDMVDGATADFTTRPIEVHGKFEVDTDTYRYPDGQYFAIYHMKATAVR